MRLRSSFSALAAGIFLLGAIGSSVQAQGTTGSVSGVVTSAASNVPLPDTRVAIAGTAVAAITGARGEYRLANVPAGPVTLAFTRIGFKQERVRVTVVAGNNSVHNQSLTESVANLTEVVITGTAGNQERRAQAASVASVNAADIVASAPISSVQELLTARTPGISVNKAAGSAGTSSQIKIRGSSSISLSNTPLIFVDGIRVSEGQPGPGVNGQTADRLNDINPDDIESIEVVKGPAAATLYGADASVGVIQIITKRGKIGGQKFTQNVKYEYANVDPAWTPPTNYANCTALLILPTSTNPLCRGQPLGTLVSDNPLVRTGAFRMGLDRNVGWSGRGGGQAYSYFLSLGYDNTVGTLPNNEFKRYSGRTNLTFQPAPEWSIDFSGNFIRSNTTLPDNDNNIYGFLGGGLLGTPLSRNDQGVPGGPPLPTSNDGWFGGARQVAAITAIQNVIQTHRNLYAMAVNYAPRTWFTNRVTFGADMLRDEITRFFPKNAVGNYAAALNIGSNTQRRTGFERFTFDYLGNIRSTWLSEQQLETNISFGAQTIATREEQLIASGSGFVTNANNVIGAAASSSGDQRYAEQTQVGFLGQLQLGWRNKLFIQAAARSDRFSSFGRPDDAFFLPKFGISYVLSEEKWLTIPFVSQMRLRAAYGETGRSPGAGAALTTLSSAPYAITGGGQAAGAIPLNPGNSNLKAERGVELEYGLDWSMFRDRVNFELTYFDKTSKDLLLRVPLPPSLGFIEFPFRNIGEVKNSGIEFGMTAKLVTMRNFTWDMRFSMNTLENKLTSLGGPVASGGVAEFPIGFTGRMRVGEQLGAMYSKKILSIDTITSIVRVDSAFTPRGNILPTFEASLSNSVTIGKYARVTALIDTKRDFSVYNLTDFFRETQLVRSNARLDPTVLSKYERLRRFGNQTPGQPAFIQTGGGAQTVNTVKEAYIMPGDFVRFRELALTVTLPASFANTLRLAGGSVTLAMQNVALWTDFRGADPEVLSAAANQFDRTEFLTVPTPKRAVIKVNFSF